MPSIRPLSNAQALDRGVRGIPATGNSDAPAVEVIDQFQYQSYFDDTLGARALLRQPPGEQIVPSTLSQVNISGYAVGLHPSSEAPVAVQFKKGEMQGDSPVYHLKPGQVIRPFGFNGKPGRFSGFDYGVPFGWLGGGAVTLVVFRTEDATVEWLDRSEVIFHRMRLPILQPAAVPAAVVPNWPTRFPWPGAAIGSTAVSQAGKPILSVNPTRILLSLRTALAAAATMRVYLIGTDAFGENSAGNIDLTDVRAYDVVWGTWANIASANFATQLQVQEVGEIITRLGAQEGGVFLVDASGTTALNGMYVDIVRYGVL